MRKGNVWTYLLCLICSICIVLSGCTAKTQNTQSKFEKPIWTTESEQKVIDISYEPMNYEAQVKPYRVQQDLGNVANRAQFGDFTLEQQKRLAQNGFVVNPVKQEQLFYIYEDNEYQKIPSFITVDSVLQVYHVFYDYSLRTLENDQLINLLEEMTNSMLNKAIAIYEKIDNETVKEAQLKNIAFFAVAQQLLEKPLPDNLPVAAKDMAAEEYQLITKGGSFNQSVIFPFELDYSQYKPRGHYTRSDVLKRYFKTMMWYGQAPFPLYKDIEQQERNVEQTMQALLITYSLFLPNDGTADAVRWENIYDPTVFYVGNTDDLNVYHYKDLLMKVYGEEPDINLLNDMKYLDEIYNEAKKLPEPQIKAKYTEVTTPVGKQFRLMGQRYIPDSEIIQELVEPLQRPIPSGLDVMGVLGSKRAYDLQINHYHENEKWPGYIEAFEKMQDKFAAKQEDTWRSNMYYGWLWELKSLLHPFAEGYPSFMTNQAWEDKSLSTALGSWAELRHDTILYGKQSACECGGGEEWGDLKGYVEPNVGAYEKLLWLTRYSRENLTQRGILSEKMDYRMERFEDLLQFLLDCSVKELRNEPLTIEEYDQLVTFGGALEDLTTTCAGDGIRWFEITSQTDKNMAVIADVHTIAPNQFSSGGYLEVGVGPAYEIYVAVPIEGEIYLTRGAVFSYYEFDSNQRLTDEEWQKMLKEERQPKQPDWMKSFIGSGK